MDIFQPFWPDGLTPETVGPELPDPQPANPLDLPAHLEAIGRYLCTLSGDNPRDAAEFDRVWDSVPFDDRQQLSSFLEYWSKVQASPEAGRRRKVEEEKERLEIREVARRERIAERDAYLTSDEGLSEAAARFEADIINLEDIPDPEPLIEGFLYKDTLVRTFGPPKSLKSFVALDMAACVSLGIPWQGQRTVQATVLYIVAEGGRGMRKRRSAWNIHHETEMKVIFYPKPVQIGDPDQMHNMIAYCRLKQIGYVIFDTQARCTQGVNENDNTEMGEIVGALDILKQQTGACVHLVHHSVGNDDSKARGATAFDGAVDTEFLVKRDKKERDKVRLVTKFQKDEEEAEDVYMIATKVGVSLALESDGAGISSGREVDPSSLPPVTDGLLLYLNILTDYSETGITQRDLAKESGRDTSTVSRAVNKLLVHQVIEQRGSRVALTDLGWDVIRWRSRHESPSEVRIATQTMIE